MCTGDVESLGPGYAFIRMISTHVSLGNPSAVRSPSILERYGGDACLFLGRTAWSMGNRVYSIDHLALLREKCAFELCIHDLVKANTWRKRSLVENQP